MTCAFLLPHSWSPFATAARAMRPLTGQTARRALEEGKDDAVGRVLENPSQNASSFAVGAPRPVWFRSARLITRSRRRPIGTAVWWDCRHCSGEARAANPAGRDAARARFISPDFVKPRGAVVTSWPFTCTPARSAPPPPTRGYRARHLRPGRIDESKGRPTAGRGAPPLRSRRGVRRAGSARDRLGSH